jgi:hypothetical protein
MVAEEPTVCEIYGYLLSLGGMLNTRCKTAKEGLVIVSVLLRLVVYFGVILFIFTDC